MGTVAGSPSASGIFSSNTNVLIRRLADRRTDIVTVSPAANRGRLSERSPVIGSGRRPMTYEVTSNSTSVYETMYNGRPPTKRASAQAATASTTTTTPDDVSPVARVNASSARAEADVGGDVDVALAARAGRVTWWPLPRYGSGGAGVGWSPEPSSRCRHWWRPAPSDRRSPAAA